MPGQRDPAAFIGTNSVWAQKTNFHGAAPIEKHEV
jgi:hypothetical protein